jgi:hypothetical protein
VTFDEAEFLSREFETIYLTDEWYCVLRGPQNAANWPIDWFINDQSGDVLLILGDGATAEEARLWAAGRIVDAPQWRPGMSLREAEMHLYPDCSNIDEERRRAAEK